VTEKRRFGALAAAGLLLLPLLAPLAPTHAEPAEERPGQSDHEDDLPEPAAPPPRPNRVGVQLGVDAATAYIFNGSNYFMVHGPQDQHGLVAPYVTWNPGLTAVTLGYRGAYQVSGDKIAELIDLGWGAEQDLWLGYQLTLPRAVTLDVVFFTFFYPFADPDKAGATVPFYLMPYATLTWSGPVVLGLDVVYVYGIQEATKSYRYLYFKPSIAKRLALSPRAALELQLAAGYKIFHDFERTDGRVDLAAMVGLSFRISPGTTLTPSFNVSWLNKDAFSLEEEIVPWGKLSFAVSL
jgi:hypothetical protein